MKSIVFLLPDLNGGGAQKMIINLANWLAQKEIPICLWLFRKQGSYEHLIDSSIHVVNFNVRRSALGICPLIKQINKSKPVIIMSALNYVNVLLMVARIFSFNSETKYIISERNHVSNSLLKDSLLHKFMWHLLLRYFYPKADKIIGISNGVVNDLKTLLPNKVHRKIVRIYNPVITTDMDCDTKNAPDIFPTKASSRFITSGRLEKQKDYPTLLKAFSNYLKHNNYAHLVILGEGSLRNELENYCNALNIKDNVSFLGFVKEPLSYLKQAETFLMTSAWEGFCNVIVEALYCKLKVISTDCPSGPSEILMGGKYGTLVDVGRADLFSHAMISNENVAFDPDILYQRAGDFHVNKIGEEFVTIFENMKCDQNG